MIPLEIHGQHLPMPFLFIPISTSDKVIRVIISEINISRLVFSTLDRLQER